MNIYNKPGKVVLVVEEFLLGEPLEEGNENTSLEGVTAMQYIIYKYDSTGCLFSVPVLSGYASIETGSAEIILPDGRYYLELTFIAGDEAFTSPLVTEFYVLYNRLPEIALKFRDLLCNLECKNCEERTPEEYYNFIFSLNVFLNHSGVILDLPAFRDKNTEINNLLVKSCEDLAYFGRNTFNLPKAVASLGAVAFIEMYERELSQLRDNNLELGLIGDLYEIRDIKKCIENFDLDYNKILREVKILNASCDE